MYYVLINISYYVYIHKYDNICIKNYFGYCNLESDFKHYHLNIPSVSLAINTGNSSNNLSKMLWMTFHMHVCIPVVQKALSVSACSIFPVLVYLQVKETRRGRDV